MSRTAAVILFLVLGFSFPSSVRADMDKPMPSVPEGDWQPGGETVMSGYTLKQFGDFVHKWRLVTVRFRRDAGEMRFVYANDIAWKALKEGSADYPDGAVFAIIYVRTGEDPDFVGSAVPGNPDRVQIMARDHEKHKDTSGWGYAMFNIQGHVFPGKPPDEVSKACDACHQSEAYRGGVFSQIMQDISPAAWEFGSPPPPAVMPPGSSRLYFVTVKVSDLPPEVREKLPAGTEAVRQLQGGTITEHMFQGSIHESIPFLGAEAVRSGIPALIINKNRAEEFSAMWLQKGDILCDLPEGKTSRMVEGIYYAHFFAGQALPSKEGYAPIEPFCAVPRILN